jgi:crotonobetaine/carnitine-CoA ligase
LFTDFEKVEPEEMRRRVEATDLPPNLGAAIDGFAARHRDKSALSFFDEGIDLTWGGLQEATLRTANLLRGLGVGPGSHVAVMLPNVPAFPLAWLGLARLGAVMIPVNISYTPREVEYALTDGEAEFLVIHAELLEHYRSIENPPVPDSRIVVVGGAADGRQRAWESLYAEASPDFAPEAAVDPDAMINIQYTSGTTGFPKGCMLSHRYWLSLGYVCTAIWATPITRIYGGANFYYMMLQRMLLNAGFNGGALYVPRRPSARNYMENVRRLGCDNMAVFEAVYKQPHHPEDGKNALKVSNIFGLTKEHQADFQDRFQVLGQELYGMTETGHISYMPAHEVAARTGSGSCGVVAPEREISLRDPQGREVATGQEGEIWTRGNSILQAYWKKPEANAELMPGDGWFRTGDIARVDRDGYYYLVGRIKDMIRRRGENIAAREIEAVMRLLPEVRDAAALAVPDPYSDEEVKLYIQLQPGMTMADLPLERVVEHAKTNLAAFKVPRYWEYRSELPRTLESDRVEKKKLRAENDDLRIGAYDRKGEVWR